MLYMAKYRCLNCDSMCTLGSSVDMTPEEAEQILIKAIQNQQFIGNPYLHHIPMLVKHECTDGSICLAHFVGFVKI